MPGVWTLKHLGSGRRQFFLKNENYMLSVSDEKLRSRLQEALHIAWWSP
jgi:hypothetical protein